MIRQIVASRIRELGEDECEIVLSTGALARDGHILVPQGCELAGFRANPIVLWQHDATQPVGRASAITTYADRICARVHFAPEGVSPAADQCRGLVKSGVVSAVSVGFDPLDGEPLDPSARAAGSVLRDGSYSNAVLSVCLPIRVRS